MADNPQGTVPPDVPRVVTASAAAPAVGSQQPVPLDVQPPSATHGTGPIGTDQNTASANATGAVPNAPSDPAPSANTGAQGVPSPLGVPPPNHNDEIAEIQAQYNELVLQQRRTAVLQTRLIRRLSQNFRPRAPAAQLSIQVPPVAQVPQTASNPSTPQLGSNAPPTPTAPDSNPSNDSPRILKRTHSPDPASPSKRSGNSAPSSAGMTPAGGPSTAHPRSPTTAVPQTRQSPLPSPIPASTRRAPLAERHNPPVNGQRPVLSVDSSLTALPAPAPQTPTGRPRRVSSHDMAPSATRPTPVVNPSYVVLNPTPASTIANQQGIAAQSTAHLIDRRVGAPVATYINHGEMPQYAAAGHNRFAQQHQGLVFDPRVNRADMPVYVPSPRLYVNVRDPQTLQVYRLPVVTLEDGRAGHNVPINRVENVPAAVHDPMPLAAPVSASATPPNPPAPVHNRMPVAAPVSAPATPPNLPAPVHNRMPVAVSVSASATPPPAYTRYADRSEGQMSLEHGPASDHLPRSPTSDSEYFEVENESSSSSQNTTPRRIPRPAPDPAQ